MSVTAATGEYEYKVPEFWTGKGVWKVSYLFYQQRVGGVSRLWNASSLGIAGKGRGGILHGLHVLIFFRCQANTEGAGLMGQTDFLVGLGWLGSTL